MFIKSCPNLTRSPIPIIGERLDNYCAYPGTYPSYRISSKFSPSPSPAARFIALSILSLGILADLAAATALFNLGFISGSVSHSRRNLNFSN